MDLGNLLEGGTPEAAPALLAEAPAELVSGEPMIMHYEATRQRVCPSLRQRLARFLRSRGARMASRRRIARIGPVAGEGTGGVSGQSGRSAESSTPPRQARRGPEVEGGPLGRGCRRNVTSGISDAVTSLRSPMHPHRHRPRLPVVPQTVRDGLDLHLLGLGLI